CALRTSRRHTGLTAAIDPVVELLEIRQVRRVKTLNHFRIDVRHGTEFGNHPREQNDDQVGLIALDARILQRQNLVGRGAQTHRAFAMQRAFLVLITDRERELVFSLNHDQALSSLSTASSMVSIAISLLLALKSG